ADQFGNLERAHRSHLLRQHPPVLGNVFGWILPEPTAGVEEVIRLIKRIVNLLHHLLLRVPACSERRIDGEYGHFLISLLVVGKPTLGQYICILGKTKYLVGMTDLCWLGVVVVGRRKYEDGCAIAQALDVIGERWAILVVRELVLGPKRFTDLLTGLHGASSDVLTQRLRDLSEAGVVRRRRLGPPAATWVYGLTDWGAELEPIILELAQWVQ